MNDPTDWFAHTLQLPEMAMLPAVGIRLARMDADEIAALWQAWRDYAPSVRHVERAATFAAVLRRGVETAVCAVYPNVAWVAVGATAASDVPESGWELLLNETPLTASLIRLFVHAGSEPVLVHMVQRRGERVPQAERGPFRLP
jgi:hypothetical protein